EAGKTATSTATATAKSRRVHIRLVLEGEGRAAGFHFTGEWKRARMRALRVLARVSAARPGSGWWRRAGPAGAHRPGALRLPRPRQQRMQQDRAEGGGADAA